MSVTIYQMKIRKWGIEKQNKPRTRREEQRRKYSEMDKRAKDTPPIWREWRRIGYPKRSSIKYWKGRGEGEDPGKDGKRSSNAGSEKMDRVDDS